VTGPKGDAVKKNAPPNKANTGTGRRVTARPTLADVAALAGVTGSIASRVLNSDPSLSARPETRERVLAAARELAYRPNALARGLRQARTMTMGLVLPNLAYAVNAEIIRGAQRQALAEGYVVLIADAAEFGLTGAAYKKLVHEGRVDGLIVASTIVGESDMEYARSLSLPVVYVNRRRQTPGVSVSVDDEWGVALAVDHLVGLGHRDLAHIGGPRDVDTARRRRSGFEARMRTHGLVPQRSWLRETELTEAGGFAAMRKLLDGRQRPTGIVASSFAIAVGVTSAVVQSGLAIPGDISVVAFHDAPIAEFLVPRLTTVRMPLAEMAEAAVTALKKLIDGDLAEDIVVANPEPRLIERASTAPPRA
jgi:LacI family transcriptional regulator